MTMGGILGDDDAQFPIVQTRDLDFCISVPGSQEVGVVGASGEGDEDVFGSDLYGGLISHEFFEECAGLGGFHSPPDPLGQESVECTGHECELEMTDSDAMMFRRFNRTPMILLDDKNGNYIHVYPLQTIC